MTRDEIRAVDEAGPDAVIARVERLLGLVADRVPAKRVMAAITPLTARVAQRENQLATNSHNSSKPPASDGFHKKTKSRREKSGKKRGGQPGHPGQTLRMGAPPHHTVRDRHREFWNGCLDRLEKRLG